MESKTVPTTKMTITRALAELKLLDKRIKKATSSTTFIGVKLSKFNESYDPVKIKASWQSINDLLKRYHLIKFAILDSNSRTKVNIGGTEYTVAEAIAKKDSSIYSQDLINEIRRQRLSVDKEVTYHNEKVQRKLDELINLTFKERSVESDELKLMTDTFLSNNKIDVVDPLNVDTMIDTLQEKYDGFMTEVDFSLSESNAKTTIQI